MMVRSADARNKQSNGSEVIRVHVRNLSVHARERERESGESDKWESERDR